MTLEVRAEDGEQLWCLLRFEYLRQPQHLKTQAPAPDARHAAGHLPQAAMLRAVRGGGRVLGALLLGLANTARDMHAVYNAMLRSPAACKQPSFASACRVDADNSKVRPGINLRLELRIALPTYRMTWHTFV